MKKLVTTLSILGVAMLLAASSPLFVTLPLTVSSAYPDGATYIGNSKCKLCHNAKAEGEQWNVWKTTKHAGAYEMLKSDAAIAAGKERGLEHPPVESPECLRCHVTGYDVEKKAPPSGIKLADSVQCESCHGPASLHAKDGKTLKFKKGANIDVKANLRKIDENVCKTCHNSDSPSWNPEQFTLENGDKVGFDFEQAKKIIEHHNPKKAK